MATEFAKSLFHLHKKKEVKKEEKLTIMNLVIQMMKFASIS